MNEVISVILPTYNRAHTLNKAIQSVFEQSYPHWPLYIVDDGSSDSTKECVLNWQRKVEKITFIENLKNQGVSATRNHGIQISKGEFICFLDSDDQWLPRKLDQQMKFFIENPEIRIVHGEEIWVRNGVRVNSKKKHQKRGGWIFTDCLKLCCVSPSTAMLKRELLEEVGLFRIDFPACEDYDLWLRIFSRVPAGFIKEELIIKYGGHEDQLSRKYIAMDYWRILALESLLRSQPLNDKWRELAVSQLKSNCKKLLKGYRKHENLKKFDEIFEVNQKYS